MDRYPPIEIAKPGRVTALGGQPFEFTESVLADLAASYDPTVFEAPLVVGHPQTNSPAYGSVGLVEHDPATHRVRAIPSDVHPSFAQAVQERLYRAVSLSMYLPDSPSNPKPGHHYLRHVGFLGAHPPAIQGLKPPAFGAEEAGVVSFGEWEDRAVAGLFRRLRDWLIGSAGQETADRVLPDYEIQSLADAAVAEMARESDPSPAGFAAPATEDSTVTQTATPSADFAEREAALAAREHNLAARVAALEAEEQRQDAARCADFAERLVTEGKLLPREKDGFAAFLAAVPAETTLSFGEGDGKTETTGRAWLEAFAAALPQRVDFGEFDPGEADAGQTAEFAAPAGFDIDPKALALHKKALAHQKQHGGDYVDAVKAVN
jgi:hypothetical protein